MSACSLLMPALVTDVMELIPPNSARLVMMLAVNSSIDSTEGCDTLSTYPKLPNVVSMPSTLTFTPTAFEPGVIQLAPEPTCSTPGMVMGIIPEIRPESPEFLDTE